MRQKKCIHILPGCIRFCHCIMNRLYLDCLQLQFLKSSFLGIFASLSASASDLAALLWAWSFIKLSTCSEIRGTPTCSARLVLCLTLFVSVQSRKSTGLSLQRIFQCHLHTSLNLAVQSMVTCAPWYRTHPTGHMMYLGSFFPSNGPWHVTDPHLT